MGFERCHPAVNFIYFTAVIAGTLVFRHPVFLVISFVCAFVYAVKRGGGKALLFGLALLPLAAVFAVYFSSYTHFGVTVLRQNFIGNNLTLESLAYGLVLGFAAAGTALWLSCVFSVVSTDKVVYLFGRVSPRLSLFLAILLRLVPRIKREARRINTAQKGIGRGAGQGNVLRRLQNCLRIFSMLVTWGVESMATVSESMRSRGSSLRGRKAFSIYRFDNRDRAYVVTMFACLTTVMMAVMLQQTDMQYDPRMVWNPVTPMSWLFFAGYTTLCLLPLALELWTEHRFRRSRKNI